MQGFHRGARLLQHTCVGFKLKVRINSFSCDVELDLVNNSQLVSIFILWELLECFRV